MVDARLPTDGSRFNAIIQPIALDGPAVSIRRFGVTPIRRDDLIRMGAAPEVMFNILEGLIKAKCNVLVSGGTGSGKTTLLNAMSGFIAPDERVITIEDAAELRLQQPHVVSLETRPPNIEGKGEITARDLVRNALRMRPDRIVVGEVRGSEVIDMLQAMNTGHEGSMTTLHANSPADSLIRLENIIGMAGINIPYKPLRQQICSAIHAIVEVERMSDGKRRVVSVQEVEGFFADEIRLREIFRFQQSGTGSAGRVEGRFAGSGNLPRCLAKLRVRGEDLPDSLFSA
jgi:pilus assembly protein CpaF